MLVDEITITIKAGNGGQGSMKVRKFRVVGGDGGKGGDVYFKGTSNVYDLADLRVSPHYEAENGGMGDYVDKKGKDAKDLTLLVPLGTDIFVEDALLTTIQENDQTFLIAKGPKGGNGNLTLKRHPHWKVSSVEELKGEAKEVHLILRFKSDILFVGYPNAGKSSLLNKLTNAKAKIAPYPFTTLEPQLGRMGTITLMDLPGLIDGTNEGKGLGTHFVQHTSSAQLTAHIVSLENEDPIKTYTALREELRLISLDLFNKEEIVILTKTDESTPEKIATTLKAFKKLKIQPLTCSILDDESIENIKQELTSAITEIKRKSEVALEISETTAES